MSSRCGVEAMVLILVARGLLIGYLSVVAALSWIRTDLPIHDKEISQLLMGRFSGLAVLAFAFLATASFLLALRAQARGRTRLFAVLAGYAGCVSVAGLTGPDRPVHNVASLLAFGLIPIGMWILESGAARYMWLAAVVSSLLAWPMLGFGLGERLTVLIEVSWLIFLSFRLPAPVG